MRRTMAPTMATCRPLVAKRWTVPVRTKSSITSCNWGSGSPRTKARSIAWSSPREKGETLCQEVTGFFSKPQEGRRAGVGEDLDSVGVCDAHLGEDSVLAAEVGEIKFAGVHRRHGPLEHSGAAEDLAGGEAGIGLLDGKQDAAGGGLPAGGCADGADGGFSGLFGRQVRSSPGGGAARRGSWSSFTSIWANRSLSVVYAEMWLTGNWNCSIWAAVRPMRTSGRR